MVVSIKVKNRAQLTEIKDQLKAEFSGKLILYRGQRKLYDHIRSGRARPNVKIHPEVENGWCALAQQFLNLPTGSQHQGLVKALLQHYGMATHYVDLTSDLDVAAWFAVHDLHLQVYRYMGTSLRRYLEGRYVRQRKGSGYIMVLAIDSPKELESNGALFKLSQLPEGALRPHRQKAWLMLDRPPIQPEPNSFLVAKITIDCTSFESSEKTKHFFPPPEEDDAYAHFLSMPFVQDPLAYSAASNRTDPKQKYPFEEFCAADRVLALPEYVDQPQEELVNHKWEDFTIYEPHPMRVWKNWRYPLDPVMHGMQGDIRDTTKLTITPSARKLLEEATDSPCSWPQIGNQGVFFTFAGIDHDKIGDDGPPYYGVWLQRDDDLVIEMPMESDDKVLTVSAGHAFLLRNGRVIRKPSKISCSCRNPESHDRRVSSVLRLSSLISAGKLILLPHPTCESLGWYIVLTGADTSHLLGRVGSIKRVFKEWLRH